MQFSLNWKKYEVAKLVCPTDRSLFLSVDGVDHPFWGTFTRNKHGQWEMDDAHGDAKLLASYFNDASEFIMEKCRRKRCNNPAHPECIHKDSGDRYCRSCARRINKACAEVVVSDPGNDETYENAEPAKLMEISQKMMKRFDLFYKGLDDEV